MKLFNNDTINNRMHQLNIKYNYGGREHGDVKEKLSAISFISTVFNFQLRHGVSESLFRGNISGELI